jgi:hypothetical protein
MLVENGYFNSSSKFFMYYFENLAGSEDLGETAPNYVTNINIDTLVLKKN